MARRQDALIQTAGLETTGENLRNWEIFRCSTQDLKQIKQCYIFEIYAVTSSTQAALFQDVSNNVYFLRKDRQFRSVLYSLTGCGICKNNVKQFHATQLGTKMLIVMEEWRVDKCHLLSINNYSNRSIYGETPLLVKTVDVSAGLSATQLDDNGIMWLLTNSKSLYIDGRIKLENVRSFQCSTRQAIALTEDGTLWLFNSKMQDFIRSDKLLKLTSVGIDVKLIHVESGRSFNICRSECGRLFSWGENSNGECGVGHYQYVSGIEEIIIPEEKSLVFLDVLCNAKSSMACALASNHCVYIWGSRIHNNAAGITTYLPKKTYTTLLSCFSLVGNYSISSRNLMFPRAQRKPIELLTAGKKTHWDSKIIIAGQELFINKTLLCIKSSYFRKLFQQNGDYHSTTSVLILNKYSYQSYHEYIKYLYNDKLIITRENYLELLQLTHDFKDQYALNYCITVIMKQFCDVESLYDIYNLAEQLVVKELLTHCKSFYLSNPRRLATAFFDNPKVLTDFFRLVAGSDEDEKEFETASPNEVESHRRRTKPSSP